MIWPLSAHYPRAIRRQLPWPSARQFLTVFIAPNMDTKRGRPQNMPFSQAFQGLRVGWTSEDGTAKWPTKGRTSSAGADLFSSIGAVAAMFPTPTGRRFFRGLRPRARAKYPIHARPFWVNSASRGD